MGFGGPVWHASGRGPAGVETVARLIAEEGLLGVGDATLGEWRDWRRHASTYHLRRRLTPQEAEGARLTMRDIRGTPEAAQRMATVVRELGPKLATLLLRAI